MGVAINTGVHGDKQRRESGWAFMVAKNHRTCLPAISSIAQRLLRLDRRRQSTASNNLINFGIGLHKIVETFDSSVISGFYV